MIFDEFSIKTLIRPVPDFPKPGVVFRDITPLLQSPKALRMVADSLIQRYVESDFSHVGALDARGFIIGSIIAYELNRPLILFRNKGKLPADVLAASYTTEYGEAFLEVHADSLCEGDSVLLLDDLIATGARWLPLLSWFAGWAHRYTKQLQSSISLNWVDPASFKIWESPLSPSPPSS